MGHKNTCYFAETCKVQTENCMKICHLYLQMDDMFLRSYIPDVRRYFKILEPTVPADFLAFKRLNEVKSHIRDFVEAGNNLYIYSPNYGNGKTTWAMRLLFTYFHTWWVTNCMTCRGVLVTVPDFLSRLKTEQHTESFKRYLFDIENCDLVVWDDISDVSQLNELDKRYLQSLINKRIQAFRANIFTAHMSKEELLAHFPPQIAQRIFTRCEVVKIVAESYSG